MSSFVDVDEVEIYNALYSRNQDAGNPVYHVDHYIRDDWQYLDFGGIKNVSLYDCIEFINSYGPFYELRYDYYDKFAIPGNWPYVNIYYRNARDKEGRFSITTDRN